MKSNSFNFWLPAELLEKSGDENSSDKMTIGGIASTMDKDTDGEFLDPNGFDLTYFLTQGTVNWNHKSKDNPDMVIGEPVKAEIVPGKGLYVEASLYPDSDMAKKVWKLMKVMNKSGKRKLGFSIEGQATERDEINPSIVKKAAITGMAVTHQPKNSKTFAEIMKSLGSDEDDSETDVFDDYPDSARRSAQKVLDWKKKHGDEVKAMTAVGWARAEQIASGAPLTLEDLKDVSAFARHEKNSEVSPKYKEEPWKDNGHVAWLGWGGKSMIQWAKNKLASIEKTLTTTSGAPLIRESVEGDNKNLKNKSLVFSKIFTVLPDIKNETALKIYNLVKAIKDKDMQGTNITEEHLEKAYKALGIDFEKSVDSDDEEMFEKEDDKIEKPKISKGKKYQKSEEADEGEEDDDPMEDDTDEPGIEKGGKLLKGISGLFKGMNYSSMDKEELKKMHSICKAECDKMLKAMSNVESSAKGDNKVMKAIGDLTNLVKSLQGRLDDTADKFEDLRRESTIRKSVDTGQLSARNRFQKSLEEQGKKVLSIKQRGEIIKALDSAAFGSEYNPFYGDALQKFETSGSLDKAVVSSLNSEKNIVIVE